MTRHSCVRLKENFPRRWSWIDVLARFQRLDHHFAEATLAGGGSAPGSTAARDSGVFAGRCQLYYGFLRSAKVQANRAKIDALIDPYVCLPFDQAAADVCAGLRHHLESQWTPIGPYDLQIAAIALANGCTVVTHNLAEFRRVPGLSLEDWESP